MTDEAEAEDNDAPEPKGRGKKGLLVGLVLALALGGAGFYATSSGLILPSTPSQEASHTPTSDLPSDISFVELEPLVVSLGVRSDRHLRFRASLEIEAGSEKTVEHLKPRIFDILNSYLRAVDIEMIENPSELVKLRAQMLRRIQLVTGEGHVRDLLILEFLVA